MRYTHILISLMLSALALSSKSQDTIHLLPDPHATPRERFADFIHAQINLNFNADSGKVEGKVSHTFRPLRPNIDTLYLDAPKIELHSIKMNGKTLDYRMHTGGFSIVFDKSLDWLLEYKVDIEYTAYPRRGMYFIGWDDPLNKSRKIIWTQGQGIDNRHWVPLFDDQADKIKTDILITFDKDYKVISNGVLVNKMSSGNEKITWHYHMSQPHSPYLMMIGIGKYNIHEEQSASGIPLYNYIYPDWDDRYDWTYTYSKEIFDYLEDEIGMPYPWVNYSQIPVPDYLYGAMENTSATVFGDFFCTDSIGFNDKNYVYVNGHELAHQWFGDLVTGRSGADHWLHESFATYYHHLIVKEFFGENEFQKMMRDNQNAALAADKKDLKGIGHSRAGTNRHYLKGAYVLKMLRYVCGDTLFRVGLKHYLKRFEFQNATSADLLSAFHESTGLGLNWFWNEWVYRGGAPDYNVEFSSDKKSKTHRFIVEQRQDTNELLGLFRMPIQFEIHYENGRVDRQKVLIENKRDTVIFDLNKKEKVAYVLFDPNSEILKKLTFKRPLKYLKAQAQFAENMLDRYDALYALREFPMKQKQELLSTVFSRDSFYLIRGEALIQLSQNGQYPIEELRQAMNSGDPKLQLYPLMLSDSIPLELQKDAEKLLKANSYQVIGLALKRLCKNYPEQGDAYLEATKDVYGTQGLSVRMTWLKIALSNNANEEYMEELVAYVSNSYEFLTRNNAIQVLKSLDYLDKDLIYNLVQGMNKANWKLAGNCRAYLLACYKNEKYRQLIDETLPNIELTTERRAAIQKRLEKAIEDTKE